MPSLFYGVPHDDAWAGVARLAAARERDEDVRFVAEHLADPLKWRKPRRIFVNSMSDLFHEKLTNEQIAAVFGVMAAAPHHTFQVLTKRARRMREWFAWVGDDGLVWSRLVEAIRKTHRPRPSVERLVTTSLDSRLLAWPLPNVWLGVSAENQAAADERIPDLLATPAAVRWVSAEPLLGPLNLNAKCPPFYAPHLRSDRISWVVAGCESGPGARPADVEWFRALRDQCATAGVAFFLKQAVRRGGEWTDWKYVIGPGPGSKQKAGGVIELPYLDGVQHAAFPEVTP